MIFLLDGGQACLVLTADLWVPACTTLRHQGYRHNSSGSSISDARGGSMLHWVWYIGSLEKLEPCLLVARYRVHF